MCPHPSGLKPPPLPPWRGVSPLLDWKFSSPQNSGNNLGGKGGPAGKRGSKGIKGVGWVLPPTHTTTTGQMEAQKSDLTGFHIIPVYNPGGWFDPAAVRLMKAAAVMERFRDLLVEWFSIAADTPDTIDPLPGLLVPRVGMRLGTVLPFIECWVQFFQEILADFGVSFMSGHTWVGYQKKD